MGFIIGKKRYIAETEPITLIHRTHCIVNNRSGVSFFRPFY